MILVNDPGDWAHVYPPLDHAEWNGFTPTDLVFPSFLFLVGCAIVFSLSSRIARGVPRRTLALQILRRSATIFAIKMFLSAYPRFHMANLRIYGVLTRIAMVYLLAGLLFLWVRRPRTLAIIAATLLVGYWALMRFVPIPGLGHPVQDFPILDPDRNLTAWIDRGVSHFTLATIHMGRLYQKMRDPEGLLSTLPAVATTIFGMLAALWLRNKTSSRKPAFLFLAGLLSLALGLLWNPWFPINKNLWTSSYVLVAGGLSLLLLALFYLLFDTQKSRTATPSARPSSFPSRSSVHERHRSLRLLGVPRRNPPLDQGPPSPRPRRHPPRHQPLGLALRAPLRLPRLHREHVVSLRLRLRRPLLPAHLAALEKENLPPRLGLLLVVIPAGNLLLLSPVVPPYPRAATNPAILFFCSRASGGTTPSPFFSLRFTPSAAVNASAFTRSPTVFRPGIAGFRPSFRK